MKKKPDSDEPNKKRGPKPKTKSIPKVEGRPTAPPHLTDEAKAEFLNVCKHLEGVNLLSQTDADTIALYADLLTQYKACMETARKEGFTYEERGYLRSHPALKLAHTVSRQLTSLASQLCLTPKARGGKASDSKQGPIDPLQEICE